MVLLPLHQPVILCFFYIYPTSRYHQFIQPPTPLKIKYVWMERILSNADDVNGGAQRHALSSMAELLMLSFIESFCDCVICSWNLRKLSGIRSQCYPKKPIVLDETLSLRKMPNTSRLKRGAGPERGGNFGSCRSSSFFLSCNENAGAEPSEFSCSYCPGGLFVDTQYFSSLKLRPSSSCDKTAISHVPLASISLFLSLSGPQCESSLCQDGKLAIQIDDQQSLAKGLFSWDKCGQMFCLERRPTSSLNTRKNAFVGLFKRERGRISDAEGHFISMSLSMKEKGDILHSSTSFLGEKGLDDSVTANEGKESAERTDIAAKETSDRPKQTVIKDKGAKFRGEGALNTSKHLWAGAVAAMVSRTFVAPLERLKLEYIVRGEKRNIFELVQFLTASQGLKGFWKGNAVNLLRTAPFKAINFYAYDTYRKNLLQMTGNEDTTNFERFVAGAAAGVTATILCIPMDTIRTRMVAPGGEALGGIIGVCRHMIQTEGFFSLYKGLLPALISMAPSGAVFYGVYDILKSSFLHSPEGKKRLQLIRGEGREESNALDQLELGPMRTLLYGAIAGACAEAATYPFEVVRRHLQMQVRATRMNALETCAKIVQQGGVNALYAGLIPSMLQVLPSAALSYFVYECMKIILRVE